jgi:hypothetical protein
LWIGNHEEIIRTQGKVQAGYNQQRAFSAGQQGKNKAQNNGEILAGYQRLTAGCQNEIV